eukprot:CAMPEP_0119382424 /NCGR_PEP_ID=MMETSP1334-20130426/72437_1 /TAXON_ID=127549 /ORGANISM="Calcidiscus leptoporus, Strain RCC1130" /LENGTH=100 /DNA_ID=CAMNT_0007402885 /DNA_START=146 /DNA_END=448 /DNA_ORIENTATION=+
MSKQARPLLFEAVSSSSGILTTKHICAAREQTDPLHEYRPITARVNVEHAASSDCDCARHSHQSTIPPHQANQGKAARDMSAADLHLAVYSNASTYAARA